MIKKNGNKPPFHPFLKKKERKKKRQTEWQQKNNSYYIFVKLCMAPKCRDFTTYVLGFSALAIIYFVCSLQIDDERKGYDYDSMPLERKQ